MEIKSKNFTKGGIFFLIGCVLAIIGGVALLISTTSTSQSESNGQTTSDDPAAPEEPNEPITFSDPDSQVIETFISADNRNRRFNIFVPGEYYRTNTEFPLVFVYHGFTQTPEVIQQEFEIDEVAERENFIIVYPAGVLNNWDISSVNDNSDVIFAGEILNFMKANYRVKERSIYSTGYSLGGFMSGLMACAYSTQFAAVAPYAGTFATGVLQECDPQDKVPYLQVHGTRDFVIPLGGNRNYASVDEALSFWAAANGQQATPDITEVSNGVEFYNFKPDGLVQHYRLIGVSHGQTVPTFPAQTVINFFKQVTDF